MATFSERKAELDAALALANRPAGDAKAAETSAETKAFNDQRRVAANARA
jgi:hypothetical protein